MATPGALATLDVKETLERIANGAITQKIAQELNVHHSNLYRKLAQHPEYQAARECGMEARLDNAEMAIESSDERTLPRAREMFRAVAWRAEREHPQRWGSKQELNVKALSIQLVAFADPQQVAPQQGAIEGVSSAQLAQNDQGADSSSTDIP